MKSWTRWARQGRTTVAAACCAAAGALAPPVLCQSAIFHASAAPATLGEDSPAPLLSASQVFREIDDPHSGAVWVLLRDPDRPAGPGRLLLAAQPSSPRPRAPKHLPPIGQGQPVIHAGDALIVEEHTAVVDARLAAIALAPAAKGALLQARLKIGGKVVHVTALAPGRAMLAPDAEVSQ